VPDFINKLTDFELVKLGRDHVTLGGLAASLATLIAAILLARIVGGALRRLRDRSHGAMASLYIVEKLVTYGLVVAGVVLSLSTLGINLTSITVFAGAIGVGVGLGLQGVVKEFVSGLVLIFDRVLNVGDFIELTTGVRGIVQEIGPRATRIRTNDQVDVLVPNSKLVEDQITNWTLQNATRRIHIPFSVAYGADKEHVRSAVLEAARAVDFTLADSGSRRTQVWLVGFGDSALNFELLVWPTVEAVKRPAAMQAAYTWAIEDALRREGLEIPFPQMDLRLRSVFGAEGEAAFEALGLRPAKPSAVARARGVSPNDAAEDLRAQAEEDDEPGAPPPAPDEL
jgi:small-conductance mechanosensitive channel